MCTGYVVDLNELEITRLAWSDAKFFGYRWLDDEDAPIFHAFCQLGTGEKVSLYCLWAHSFSSDIIQSNRISGPLLTIGVEFLIQGSGEWKVIADFGSNGGFEIICEKFSIDAYEV